MLKKQPLVLLLLFALIGCQQIKLSSVELIKSRKMEGILNGSVQLNKTVSLKINPENDQELFEFDQVKTGKITLNLEFTHEVLLPGMETSDRQIAKLKLEIKPSGEEGFKLSSADKISINSEKMEGLDCSNVLKIRKSGTKITVDMKNFKSLEDCSGDAYRIAKIGERELNPKRVKGVTGLLKVKGNYFSEAEDEALGREFVDNYLYENSHRILDQDHPTSIYVRELIEDIAEQSDRPDIEPKVYVINANILNAFALPGGYVFVFRGLMDAAKTEAELAGVLGHEWAHVTARHGTEGMTRAIRQVVAKVGLVLAVEILTYDGDDDYQEVRKKRLLKDLGYLAFDVSSSLFMLGRGRHQELEADRLGTQYIAKLGLAPWGLADMFKTFAQRAPNSGSTLESLLSTHPQHSQRISRIYAYASLFHPAEDLSDFEVPMDSPFSIAKRELENMPVPSKSESDAIGNAFNSAVQEFAVDKSGANLFHADEE